MKFFPREDKFFELFEAQTEKLSQAALLLKRLRKNPQELGEISIAMKKIEEEADDIGHQIVDKLHRSFITPLEQEDIDILRQDLDDIMDGIEKAVNRMVIYKIPLDSISRQIRKYLEIIEESILEIKQGIKEIRNLRKFSQVLRKRCERINLLENKGDQINRTALKSLMNPVDVSPERNLEIMKKKEIYETLEDTIDRCEDVANILETILIKNI